MKYSWMFVCLFFATSMLNSQCVAPESKVEPKAVSQPVAAVSPAVLAPVATTTVVPVTTPVASKKTSVPVSKKINPTPVAAPKKEGTPVATKEGIPVAAPVVTNVEIPIAVEARLIEKENIYAPLDSLLQKYVSTTGKVNYKGIKADAALLEACVLVIQNNLPLDSMSKNEKLAYWINAYNVFTVKMIVDNYPVSSITKLYKGKPWDEKWINIGDKTYSLNQIENDIIRPRFKDARIHFAINCAAKSCPPLHNRAFTADNVQQTLTDRTRKFIRDKKQNTIEEGSANVSKIFDWYAKDFGTSLTAYLNKYASVKIQDTAVISFKEYDWGLNE